MIVRYTVQSTVKAQKNAAVVPNGRGPQTRILFLGNIFTKHKEIVSKNSKPKIFLKGR